MRETADRSAQKGAAMRRSEVGCGPWAKLAGILTLTTTAACTHTDTTARAIEDLRADVTRVSADRDRLEERVAALERAEQARSDVEAVQPSPQPPPAVDARPPAPKAAAADARDADGARGAKSTNDAKRDFDAALGLMRAKQFDKAIDGLTAFLVRYPDHELVDQAMFWRGDCLYEKGAHSRAVDQLEGLIARFPASSKAPDAMLKLGLSQKRLGADDQARHTFAELKQRYPKSDAARQAPRP